MKKCKASALFLVFLLFYSCGTKVQEEKIDYTLLSDEERKKIAIDLAQQTIIVDGHVDLPYRMEKEGFGMQGKLLNVSERSEGGNFDYPRAKEGGLDAPFMSIYIPAAYQDSGGAKNFADSLIIMTKRLPETWPDKFALAHSPDEVAQNFKAGKISLPLGMENGAALEGDINNLKYFYEKGIRYITLTHGKDNLIGDSSYDTAKTHGGLSDFGKQVVKEMNNIGIMVDISHVSDETFYEVMAITKTPPIASHSSARHFTPGFERNMDDDMIKVLAQKGGVIMINFGGDFIDQQFREQTGFINEHMTDWLTKNNLNSNDPEALAYRQAYLAKHLKFPNVQKVADHFDHVLQLVGIDHLGLGSDFDGVGDTLPIGLKDVSMYPNLIAELLKRGYSKEDIEKICYKNIFRIWQAVEELALEN